MTVHSLEPPLCCSLADHQLSPHGKGSWHLPALKWLSWCWWWGLSSQRHACSTNDQHSWHGASPAPSSHCQIGCHSVVTLHPGTGGTSPCYRLYPGMEGRRLPCCCSQPVSWRPEWPKVRRLLMCCKGEYLSVWIGDFRALWMKHRPRSWHRFTVCGIIS